MSSPPRVVVFGSRLVPGETVALPDAEARHLRVSRVAPDEGVVLLDGAGGRARARLSAGRSEVVVESLLPERGEPARRVTLLLGVGELARVEWAVEKGTECGAAAFALVAAARSQRAHVAAAARDRLEFVRCEGSRPWCSPARWRAARARRRRSARRGSSARSRATTTRRA